MKSKRFYPLFLFALVATQAAYSQTIISNELHDKIFKTKMKEVQTSLDLMNGKEKWGEVNVKLIGENLVSLERKSLIGSIKNRVSNALLLKVLTIEDEWMSGEKLPFEVKYDPSLLVLNANIALENLSATERSLQEMTYNKENSLMPAPLSGAFTFRNQQIYSDKEIGDDYFVSQMEGFVNFYSFVLEGQGAYQSNIDNKWTRGDVRLVKDFPDMMIRSQLGDLNYETISYQTHIPIRGLSIAKNFSLNPYRTPYPQVEESFTLETRSKVDYFVNGNLVKSEVLPPGNYSIRDIPLQNGINTIVLEIEDAFGQKRVETLRQSTSINLLNSGEAKFNVSLGNRFENTQEKRIYDEENVVSSSFLQYGLTKSLTMATHYQNDRKFKLYGVESVIATSLGSFEIGFSRGENQDYGGNVYGIGYNLAILGNNWFSAHHLNIKAEKRENNFVQTYDSNPSFIKNLYSLNYSLPLFSSLTLSMGGHFGEKDDEGVANRYGYDASLGVRLFSNLTATLYAARNRDEFNNVNEIAYLFLNITFPEKDQYINAFAETTSQTKRITHVKDNLNRLNTFKARTVIEDNEDYQRGDVDLMYNSTLADLGVRFNGLKYKDGDISGVQTALKLDSSFVFASNDETTSFAISRPVQTSFALLKPNEYLEGQDFKVKSTSPFSEGMSDFMGKTVFVNLLPYQFRKLQLDPSELDIGYSLGQENFILYPTYKSGHLISVGAPGKVALRGSLSFEGVPQALVTATLVGEKQKLLFFTNRTGEFLVENILPGTYKLLVDGKLSGEIYIPEDKKGLYQIGKVELSDE